MPRDEKTGSEELVQTFDVLLLSDYWPTQAELALNPDTEEAQLEPPPHPEHSQGMDIVIEPRFKAGATVKLTLQSAFKLVEEGKAKRADWGQ